MDKLKNKKLYDLIIIGAGPAGLTAALYAGRYKLNTLVIGKVLGGTPLEAHLVENWPGIQSIKGHDLMKNMLEQVKSLDVEIINKTVSAIKKVGQVFRVYTGESSSLRAKSIILSMGNRPRRLDVQGEKELIGKGVSYCVACDGPLFRDKIVAVIGGGDSACSGSILLSAFAKKVYLIYRKGCLRAAAITREKVEKNKKIEIIYNTNITEIQGKDKVQAVKLDNNYNNQNILKVEGVFIEIGSVPNIALCKNLGVELDEMEQIKVDKKQAVDISGVFAAGDITNSTDFKQIITASSQGAIAVRSVYDFLK